MFYNRFTCVLVIGDVLLDNSIFGFYVAGNYLFMDVLLTSK